MFIPDPDFFTSQIPDTGVKKAPDPGSGSEKLDMRNYEKITRRRSSENIIKQLGGAVGGREKKYRNPRDRKTENAQSSFGIPPKRWSSHRKIWRFQQYQRLVWQQRSANPVGWWGGMFSLPALTSTWLVPAAAASSGHIKPLWGRQQTLEIHNSQSHPTPFTADFRSTVFRNRDMLWTNPDPRIRTLNVRSDSALFVSSFQENNKKKIFVLSFCLLLTVGTYIYTSIQKSLRSHKIIEIKVFLNFFGLLKEGFGPHPYKQIRIRIGNAQKFTNPTDPEHWFKSIV